MEEEEKKFEDEQVETLPLFSPLDKLKQLGEGRVAEPIEGTIVNAFIDWIRVLLFTVSSFGLFYVFVSFADERINQK